MQRLDVVNGKILHAELLNRWLAVTRFKGKKIAFTNGCFDIIHRGHVEYLAQAADQGDVLMIGLNTDDSVRRLKGPSRPLQDEKARALVLASLSFVDAVVLFDEDTPYELIRHVQPDVLVKGGDYRISDIAGNDIVSQRGGKVITIPLVQGYSSTSVINRINSKL